MNGIKHGRGKFTWPNGDVYEGEFVNGTRNGYGITILPELVHEGEYVNSYRTGVGKTKWVNGNVFEGDHVNGYPIAITKF